MQPALVTQLVSTNFSTLPAGYECPAHLHHFYQFDAILAGQVDILLERGNHLRPRAGDGVLIPPLTRHGYRAPGRYRQASFKFHLAPRFWPLFGRAIRRVRLTAALREIVRLTAQRGRQGAPLWEPQAVATLTLCLISTVGGKAVRLAHDPTADPLRRRLWPLLERIESEPHTRWTVAGMARACCLSPDHFSRQFHRILRQPPQQYLFRLRMRAAAEALLADPPLPIKTVAEKANYATVHSFSRAFKQMFGVSPGAYREASAQL
jgi:AraC-like DNA-binding protein